MRQDRLFPEGTIPDYTRPDWYAGRETAPHLDQDAHRPRLEVAARFVRDIYTPGMTVSDLGAGDGGLLALIADTVPDEARWGYDLVPTCDTAAERRGQRVFHADVLTDPIEFGTVTVTTEMLEHLVDPHAFVRRLASRTRFLVASSPAYETAEAHYEYHTWAWDMEGYAHMLTTNGWSIQRHEIVGVFQVALCASEWA